MNIHTVKTGDFVQCRTGKSDDDHRSIVFGEWKEREVEVVRRGVNRSWPSNKLSDIKDSIILIKIKNGEMEFSIDDLVSTLSNWPELMYTFQHDKYYLQIMLSHP